MLFFVCSLLQAQSVSQLFVDIPPKYFTAITGYVQKKFPNSVKNSILAKSDSSGFTGIEIDNAGGFMCFNTAGDGDAVQAEMALWNFGKTKLLVLCINVTANCTHYTKEVFCFEVKNNALTDRTALLLPQIKLTNFQFAAAQDKKIFTILEQQHIKWNWRLPRKGKTIRILSPFYDCADGSLPEGALHFKVTPRSSAIRLQPQTVLHPAVR